MRKGNVAELIGVIERHVKLSGSIFSSRVGNLARQSAKRTLCAISISILLGDLAQMPDLFQGHGAPVTKVIVRHEFPVPPPDGAGREIRGEFVKRELCLAKDIGIGRAAAVVILARMAGIRRIVPCNTRPSLARCAGRTKLSPWQRQTYRAVVAACFRVRGIGVPLRRYALKAVRYASVWIMFMPGTSYAARHPPTADHKIRLMLARCVPPLIPPPAPPPSLPNARRAAPARSAGFPPPGPGPPRP